MLSARNRKRWPTAHLGRTSLQPRNPHTEKPQLTLLERTQRYLLQRRSRTPDTPPDPLRDPPAGTSPAGALSQALCYIHRISASGSLLRPRILCLHGSPDHPPQYIPVVCGSCVWQNLPVSNAPPLLLSA